MVDCTALEMRSTFTGTVGSNPTLSAIVTFLSPSKSPEAVVKVQASAQIATSSIAE